jgi:methylenetetrahydrofolate reductase (NADPH)
VQFTCRDRNRLALQSDLMGAALLGAHNLLLMAGDDVGAGDHPGARAVYDLDVLELLRAARQLRDDGTYLSGRKLEDRPHFFIGAVENPFAPPVESRPGRLAKKVEAGAEFIQTQIVFNVPRLQAFLAHLADMGVLERVFLLPSVYVPRSTEAARYLRDRVPGVDVPEAVIDRLEGRSSDGQAEEGIALAVEIVEELRRTPGVAGIHLISIKWEAGVRAVVERAGLLPRPEASATNGVA